MTKGDRVRVVRLGTTTGMMIAARHLAARRIGATGTVRGYVPGHGGDVWFVQHDDLWFVPADDPADIGAYVHIGNVEADEIELLPVPPQQP